ncbi:unnamed protein product, partial [Strongylus vulgaris]
MLATYVWIDGTGENLREKTRTLEKDPGMAGKYPSWSFDGSSTYQANKGEDSDMQLKANKGEDSDMQLKEVTDSNEKYNVERKFQPVAIYPDPFLGGNHKLVLCETLDANNKPTKNNHRNACAKVMEKIDHLNPWFGMEQEYLLLDRDGYPLG